MMIGNLVQNQFSAARNWPFGSAASFIVMALVLARGHALSPGEGPGPGRRPRRWAPGCRAGSSASRAGWSTSSCTLPILVLVVFSFNDSKFSVELGGFTLDWYHRLLERPDILRGLKASLIVGGAVHRDLGRAGHADGPGPGPAPVPRTDGARGLPLCPDRHAGDRGRDLAPHPLRAGRRCRSGLTTIIIAHVAFSISFVVIVVLARLEGMDQNLEEAAMILGRRRDHHLLEGDGAPAVAGHPVGRPAGLHHVVRRLRDHLVRVGVRAPRRCRSWSTGWCAGTSSRASTRSAPSSCW